MSDFLNDFPAHTNEHVIDVPGGQVRAFVVPGANPDAPPVVIVHGGPGGSCGVLRRILPDGGLPPVTTIFYDQLGSHYSRLPEGTPIDGNVLWNVDRFLAELEILINTLVGADAPVSLLGHSWGATLSGLYAAKHPHRTHRLILSSPFWSADTWVRDSLALLDNFDAAIKDCILEGDRTGRPADQTAYDAAMALVNAHHYLRKTAPVFFFKDQYFNIAAYQHMWGNSEYCCAGTLQTFDLFPSMPQITARTLVSCGRYDTSTPATCARALSALPDARLHVFENSGHSPYADETPAYRDVVWGFITA